MVDINDVLHVASIFKSQAEADLMKDTYSKVFPSNMISFCDATIELLKSQQAEIERLKAELAKILRCKECKYFQEGIDINGEPFTRCTCGKREQAMTWGASVTPDWFCGHAEAKDGE